MAELVTGALARLVSKLGCHLLVGEYNLQRGGVQGDIRFLQSELESMQAALEMISEAPANQLDKQNSIWAGDIRELSYDIEDCIDTFMVVASSRATHSKDRETLLEKRASVQGIKVLVRRCSDLLPQLRVRRGIATDIRKIKRRVKDVCDRRDRFEIANDVAKPITVRIDPRLLAQYKEDNELVGITEARDELIQILTEGDDVSTMSQGKILSIVGFGGLGKTTLANAVYEKISSQFDCRAFVSVSQNPDVKKIFKGILYELGKIVHDEIIDDRLLINELRGYLHEKRYFIVIDDIWDISDWEIIKCALPHNSCGYRIVTTTRILNIAKQVGGPYKMKPLSLNNSKTLFYSRIFGSDGKDNNNYKEKYLDEELVEVSLKILKKCAGVPLAIVTIASLLASKRRCKMEWHEVGKSIGTGLENSLNVENMRMILSLSYYNMPPHLRTCLL